MTLKMRILPWVVIVMSWCAPALAADPEMDPRNGKFPIDYMVMRGMAVPDELIVRVTGLVSKEKILTFFADKKINLTIPEQMPIGDGLVLFRTVNPKGSSLEEKAKRLKDASDAMREVMVSSQRRAALSSIGAVASSPDGPEPNLIMTALASPGDEHFKKQCGLTAVNAEKAWDVLPPGADASKVNIAIVDSGLTDKHPDLSLNAEPANPGADLDRNGHGTHVAGIIGGQSDDMTGIVGVTWKTNIKAYGFLDARGRGTSEGALRQVNAAIATKPHIVVLAWGTGVHSEFLLQALTKANGTLFVAAAGNNRQDITEFPIFPAAYDLPNLISVMATTCDDQMAPFSNFSTARVDLAAPGEGRARDMRIYSTVLNDLWGNLAGTSMSAAFVAGAAALVLQHSMNGGYPCTPPQLKEWLTDTGTEIPSLLDKSKYGKRLDLYKAVKEDKTRCKP